MTQAITTRRADDVADQLQRSASDKESVAQASQLEFCQPSAN